MSSEPSGCSGRGRSRRRGAGFGLAHRDDLAVALKRHPARHVGPAEVGRLLAVAREARVERAVGVVAGEGEVLGRLPPAEPTTTILPSPWIATAVAWRLAEPEVGRLLAVAGEARVERAVGVVAGEREVAVDAGAAGADRRRSCRRPGSRPRSPRRQPPKTGRLLAVAGEARVERAVRGCSGRARSRSPTWPQVKPTTTILPFAWIATPVAPSARRRSRSSACRRRRSSCRASRWGCSGRGRSRAAGRAPTDHDDLAVGLERHPVRPSLPPKSVVCLPSPEKLVSSDAVRVVAGEREVGSVPPVSPTATILPFAWMATAFARPPKSVVCLPSPEKLGSSEPFGL